MVGLPGRNFELADGGEATGNRAVEILEDLPHSLAATGASVVGFLQAAVQHAGADVKPLQVGAQWGTVTLGRVEFKLTTRKLRQAFAEPLIKRSVSSMALRTWARIHWRLGSLYMARAASALWGNAAPHLVRPCQPTVQMTR